MRYGSQSASATAATTQSGETTALADPEIWGQSVVDTDSEKEANADAEAESEAPKTALQQLVALGDRVCSLLTLPRDVMNESVAQRTRALAAATKPQPAATVGSLALGLPHAHLAHPPYVPLIPLGPAILGFSNDVLINGIPALVSGALGTSPSCCGLAPFYEVFTGSSKVLIGGERAVRVLDLTFHCAPAAGKSGAQSRAIAGVRRTLQATERTIHAAHKVEDAADFSAQRADAARVIGESEDSDSPGQRAAVTESAAMAVSSHLMQKAQDQLTDALTKLMGRDPATPAGTPGVIVSGSANVLIGGFPMPGGSAVVRGLLRLLP